MNLDRANLFPHVGVIPLGGVWWELLHYWQAGVSQPT